MRYFFFFLAVASCGGVSDSAHSESGSSPLTAEWWPPQAFQETVEVVPTVGAVAVVRAAIFVDTLTGEWGSYIFTPTWDGVVLSSSEIRFEYPELDHVFIEWVLHFKSEGRLLAYGTVTATDTNQGTVIRGAIRDFQFDPFVSHQVGISIGRVSGPSTLEATLLSLTVQ